MLSATSIPARHRLARVLSSCIAATLACCAVSLASAVAPAGATVFSNPGTITIPDPNCTDPDIASPYPSNITVPATPGTITDVNVTLTGVTHPFEGDLELLLVGPGGGSQNIELLSDAGTGSLNNATVTFDDSAAAQAPQNTAWGPGTYKPSNYTELSGADTFPAPAPSPSASTTLAAAFNGATATGTWSLYVIDDACPDAGSIAGGWSLNITTASLTATSTSVSSSLNPSQTGDNVTFTATVTSTGSPVTTGTVTFTEGATTLASNVALNGAGQASFSKSNFPEGNHIVTATYNGTGTFATSSGSVNQRVDTPTTVTGNDFCNPGAIAINAQPTTIATPYPSNIFVSGTSTTLGKVVATLKNVTHPFPDDIDVLLVGPGGQNLVLVSDAGTNTSNVTVNFDDAAAGSLAQAAAWGAPGSTVSSKPIDYDPAAQVDVFLAPAPSPSAATTLATFSGTDPNGKWSVYVVSDGAPDTGTIAGGWCLKVITPPDTSIDSGPTGLTNDPTPTFTFSSATPGVTFECKVDAGGTFTACTSPHTTATLSDGAHTFFVRAVDAGAPDPTPAQRSFTVDATPPQTTIDSGPSGPTNDTTPTFTFSSSEPASTFECKVDAGGTFTLCTSPETTAALSEGSHTFFVRATDPAGNTDQTPAQQTFTVDTTAPQTTINSGPSGLTNDATPTFTFSSSEPSSTFECKVDAGSTFASCTSPHTTAALADGSHTFFVRATDPAGNTDTTPAQQTFTVDATAPQTTIDSGPPSVTNDTTPTFTFSSSEAGSTFECNVDGGAIFASCTSPETTAALSEGSHTFFVRATDPAGNTDQTPAQQTFTVDTTAPQTTIDSGPSGPTNDTSPTFTFSSSEAGSTFECKVDAGGTFASCTSPETTAALSEGSHTFFVRATDPAGNTDQTPAQQTFTVDTTAPQTTIDSGPSGLTNDPTPTFTFSSSEPSSTFECKVDAGGTFASCTSPETTAALADGAHTFFVRATDPAGNTDPTPAQQTFTVDATAPQTTIDSGPSGLTNDATPTFTFSSSEAGSTFECKVDAGGTFTSCTTPHTTAALADGAHTFFVRATDPAGNTDATPAQQTFTVDATAPQTTIDSGPSGLTNDATPTFTFSSSEAGSTFECKVDAGGTFTSCTTPHTTAALADGAHTFFVRATDPAGNTDPTPAQQTFTVDATAPQTTIDSGPSGPTNDTTPTFTFSSSEPASTFECKVDAGGTFTLCTSPHTTAALSEGSHTFFVRATDPAGNTDPTPAQQTFTVDTTAPQTTIDSGPSGLTNDATPTFTFSSSEPSSTFECKVDAGGTFASCTSPETTAALADGAHTFFVRATDPAGNTDATPAQQTFTVDATAPQTTIDSGPSGLTNDATPTFTFSSSEAGSTFECKVDAGGTFSACTSPHTTAALADGAHTFFVRATDPAGNTDATPAQQAFTVDAAEPQTTIDSGPTGLTNDATPTFTFSSSEAGSTFECKVDAGGTFASCTSPHTTAALADGAHTFFVRATDPAGNTDATPAQQTFTVDTTAPQTTIDSGPSGLTNDATPTFTFSSSEAGSTFECKVDAGGTFTACTSPHTTAALADGAHTFFVRATDPAGNTDATPAQQTFTVDATAPQTTIDSGPSGLTNDATPTFTFSSSEAGSTFECKVDAGGTFTACTSPHTTAALADGAHTFFVRATDAAGNTDATPAQQTFTVDAAEPQTTIDSGPSGLTNDATPTFTFSSNEAGSTFECKVDAGGTFAACTSPHTTAALADGAHTFFVRATDPAGNTDQTPATRDFTVDTVPPETTIDSGPAGLTSDSTPTFTFSSNVAGSTFECKIDGGAYASCTSPHTTAALADGAHTLSVRATDPAGNTDATPATRTFTVDASPPDTTITAGPSGSTTEHTPTFTFTSSESGSTFECKLDAAAFAACTSPTTTAALADGAHTFSVRATDAAGNTDPSPATRSFTVTTAQPPVLCEGRLATIVGTGPVVTGTPGRDVIVGGSTRQTIDGRGGDDLICAGPGNDRVLGGSGDDSIRGGAGNDRLLGQTGDDLLLGGAGNDDIRGQAGRDVTGGGDGNDRVDGGAGNDLLDERRLGGVGTDRLFGGTGNDRVRTAGGTKDEVDCGPGIDSAVLDTLDRQRRCEHTRRVALLTLTSGSAIDPLALLAGRPAGNR